MSYTIFGAAGSEHTTCFGFTNILSTVTLSFIDDTSSGNIFKLQLMVASGQMH